MCINGLQLKKRYIHSSFKHNIWGADLTYMQLISKCNKRIRFLFDLLKTKKASQLLKRYKQF